MLNSFLKSYNKGVFDSNYKCPVEKSEILNYLQILLPVFIFSNTVQSAQSNISILIPYLLIIIHNNLGCMVTGDSNQDLFRKYLIEFLKKNLIMS